MEWMYSLMRTKNIILQLCISFKNWFDYKIRNLIKCILSELSFYLKVDFVQKIVYSFLQGCHLWYCYGAYTNQRENEYCIIYWLRKIKPKNTHDSMNYEILRDQHTRCILISTISYFNIYTETKCKKNKSKIIAALSLSNIFRY